MDTKVLGLLARMWWRVLVTGFFGLKRPSKPVRIRPDILDVQPTSALTTDKPKQYIPVTVFFFWGGLV